MRYWLFDMNSSFPEYIFEKTQFEHETSDLPN